LDNVFLCSSANVMHVSFCKHSVNVRNDNMVSPKTVITLPKLKIIKCHNLLNTKSTMIVLKARLPSKSIL